MANLRLNPRKAIFGGTQVAPLGYALHMPVILSGRRKQLRGLESQAIASLIRLACAAGFEPGQRERSP
jgi:hypothetical protein